MKQIIIVLLLGLVFTTCKKDSNNLYSKFAGKWEYERFDGYPFNNTYQPPGNGNIIVLRKNGDFERMRHDTVVFKGSYYLKEKKDCYQNEKRVFFLTNDNSFSNDRFIEIDDNKLLLCTSSCLIDGGITIYRKLAGE
ncbi:MAG TPA: hypothetical protein VGQ09_02665 [Chitinophagaceae bacterium]|nr:hypothetical protein [Chitinophagaceae bacterium]